MERRGESSSGDLDLVYVNRQTRVEATAWTTVILVPPDVVSIRVEVSTVLPHRQLISSSSAFYKQSPPRDHVAKLLAQERPLLLT